MKSTRRTACSLEERSDTGHSFGTLCHYYGREAGLEFREDVETVLVPGMVVSMEPMVTVPEGGPGAGGYREHDMLIVTEDGAENLTGFPFGPEHNVVRARTGPLYRPHERRARRAASGARLDEKDRAVSG